MLTFDEILMKSGIKESFLKMDCEGCEYSLLTENSQFIEHFSMIQLEFHRGHKNISHKLKRAGFITYDIRGRSTPSLHI